MKTLAELLELAVYFLIVTGILGGFEWALTMGLYSLAESDTLYYAFLAMFASVNFICSLCIFYIVHEESTPKSKVAKKRTRRREP